MSDNIYQVSDVVNVHDYEKVDYTSVIEVQSCTEVMIVCCIINSMPGSWFNGACAQYDGGKEYGIDTLYRTDMLSEDIYV